MGVQDYSIRIFKEVKNFKQPTYPTICDWLISKKVHLSERMLCH